MGLGAKQSEFTWLCVFGEFFHLSTPLALFSEAANWLPVEKKVGTWGGGGRAGVVDFLTQLSGEDRKKVG